jgi:Uncharacterised nucleotidyltransferase
MTMYTLSREARLILALAKIEFGEVELADCRALMRRSAAAFDWAAFLDQACRHRVLPLIARNVVEHQLYLPTDECVAIPHGWLFATVYEGNFQRNTQLYGELGRVLEAVNATGVTYALRKGPLLAEGIYGDRGLRVIADMDLLAAKEDAKAVADALRGLGYLQGKPSANGRTVEPFDRGTRLFWSVHVDNLLPFVKLAFDPEFPQKPPFLLKVDVSLNVLAGGDASRDTIGELLSRSVAAISCGQPTRSLHPADALIDICVHLWKEADARYYIQTGKDLTLLKFIDVAASFATYRESHDVAELVERVRAYRVHEGVYYAVAHANEIFPGLGADEFLATVRPDDVDYLDGYGYREGSPQRWSKPFLERLFGEEYRKELVGRSAIPKAW